MNIAKSAGKHTFARLFVISVGLIVITYLSRELEPSRLGSFFLFQALMTISAIGIDFGVNGAVEKRMTEGASSSRTVAAGILMKLPPSIVYVAGVLIASEYLNAFIGIPVALELAIAGPLLSYANLTISVLNGELRVGATASLRVVRQIAWIVLAVTAVTTGAGAVGVVQAVVVSVGLMLFLGAVRMSTRPRLPKRKNARSVWEFARYNFVTNFGEQVDEWLDVLILRLLVGQTAVAVYELAWRVSNVILVFNKSFNRNVLPATSSVYSKGESHRLDEFLRQSVFISLIPTVPALFGALILSDKIMVVLFSPEYGAGSAALVVLAGSKVIRSVIDVYTRVLDAIGGIDKSAFITLVGFLVNGVSNVVLVSLFGVVGAALGTTLGTVVTAVLFWHALADRIDFSFPTVGATYVIVATLPMTMVVYSVESAVSINSVPLLVGTILLGVIVYGVVLGIFPPLRNRLRDAHRLFLDFS